MKPRIRRLGPLWFCRSPDGQVGFGASPDAAFGMWERFNTQLYDVSVRLRTYFSETD